MPLVPIPGAGYGYTFSEGICPAIQELYTQFMRMGAPQTKRTRIGFTEGLTSEINTDGVDQMVIPSNGKNRLVKLRYNQRAIPDDIITTVANPADCKNGIESAPLEVDLEVNCYAEYKMAFDQADLRTLCESGNEYRLSVIRDGIDALLTNMNNQLLAKMVLNFGTYQDGSAEKDFALIDTNQPVPYEWAKMVQEYQEIGGQGDMPLVVGACGFDLYAIMANMGCCNQFGTDVSRATTAFYFKDDNVNNIVGRPGSCSGVMLVPGMVQILQWYKNVGEYAQPWNGKYEYEQLVDPVTGLIFDMDTHYDDCDRRYVIKLYKHFDLHVIPADAYKPTDRLFGTNGSLKFNVV